MNGRGEQEMAFAVRRVVIGRHFEAHNSYSHTQVAALAFTNLKGLMNARVGPEYRSLKLSSKTSGSARTSSIA